MGARQTPRHAATTLPTKDVIPARSSRPRATRAHPESATFPDAPRPRMARDGEDMTLRQALCPRPRMARAAYEETRPARPALAPNGERHQEARPRRVPSPRMASGAQKKTATACALPPTARDSKDKNLRRMPGPRFRWRGPPARTRTRRAVPLATDGEGSQGEYEISCVLPSPLYGERHVGRRTAVRRTPPWIARERSRDKPICPAVRLPHRMTRDAMQNNILLRAAARRVGFDRL